MLSLTDLVKHTGNGPKKGPCGTPFDNSEVMLV